MRSFSLVRRESWPEWHETPRFLDSVDEPDLLVLKSGYALGSGFHQLTVDDYGWVLSDVELNFFDNGGFMGGWDGANGDPYSSTGPKSVTLNGKQFFLYRTDHKALGTISIDVHR